MTKVNIHQAKTHLSRLLQRVAAGEQVTIANRGVPVATLVPADKGGTRRLLGTDRGRFVVPDDFNAPLPDDVLAGFLGEEEKKSKKKRRKRK